MFKNYQCQLLVLCLRLTQLVIATFGNISHKILATCDWGVKMLHT